MHESFKINCYPLNRSIRINIYLPDDYNETGRYYPAIYFFDGQNTIKDSESYNTYSLDLETVIEKLKENNKEAIFITIAAANDPIKRIQEYKDIILANFISNSIHPYLNSRYRINNYVYSFACGLASLNALALNQTETFKGTVLLSPEADFDTVYKLSLKKDNLYYIYVGKKELNGCPYILTQNIKKILPNTNVVADDNHIHNESAWKHQVYEALNYLII